MTIIDYIKMNIWPIWGNLICVIIGAAISYYSIKLRENKKLKLDLQLKTLEQYHNAVYDLCISMFQISITEKLYIYNKELEQLLRSQSSSDDIGEYTSRISKSMFDEHQDNLKRVENYGKRIVYVISIFETKEIILYKFHADKQRLEEEHEKYTNSFFSFCDLLINHVIERIEAAQFIDAEVIVSLNSLEKQNAHAHSEINRILTSIDIGMQNEFLGRVFKRYKVTEKAPPQNTSKGLSRPR